MTSTHDVLESTVQAPLLVTFGCHHATHRYLSTSPPPPRAWDMGTPPPPANMYGWQTGGGHPIRMLSYQLYIFIICIKGKFD